MNFFSQSGASSSPSLPAPTPHRVKDVGFVEAIPPAFHNSYGIADEALTVSDRFGEAARFAREHLPENERMPVSGLFGDEINQRVIDDIEKLRSRGVEIPPEFNFSNVEDMRGAAFADEGEAYRERQEKLSRATGAGKIGGFLGSVAGGFDDFENIVTLPLGVPGRLGLAAAILGEATINAGIEGATFGKRQEFLETLGVESDETLLEAMALGAAFGGGFAAAARGVPAAARAAPRVAATPFAVGRRLLLQKTPDELADTLSASPIPQVAAHGHAIRAEIDTQRLAEAQEARVRSSIEDDALFLDDLTSGRATASGGDARVSDDIDISPPDTVLVPVRTSDGVEQTIELPKDVSQSARIVERFENGEAIPLRELESMGANTSKLEAVRPIITHYDEMDAGFRGVDIPDEFDPIDEADIGILGARDLRVTPPPARLTSDAVDVADVPQKAAAIRIAEPEDFDGNLSRLVRHLNAVNVRRGNVSPRREEAVNASSGQVDAGEISPADVGPIGEVDELAIGERGGKVETVSTDQVLQDIQEDANLSQAVKECLI